MGLVDLNREVFLPISQELIGLNVSGNPGLNIRSRMFELLPNLKQLGMARMRRQTLSSDYFSYPNVIERLDLSDNNFIDIDDGVFQLMGNLVVSSAEYSFHEMDVLLTSVIIAVCESCQESVIKSAQHAQPPENPRGGPVWQ